MSFLVSLFKDQRIPRWDKIVLVMLAGLVVSPVDFVPDWFPVIGQLDDLVMIGLISEYIFHYLDDEIPLSHWPYQLKYFVWLKTILAPFAFMAPKFVRNKLFRFKPRPF
jgi:uncharacterized membrane protein YkvA (DUF1232 family)